MESAPGLYSLATGLPLNYDRNKTPALFFRSSVALVFRFVAFFLFSFFFLETDNCVLDPIV